MTYLPILFLISIIIVSLSVCGCITSDQSTSTQSNVQNHTGDPIIGTWKIQLNTVDNLSSFENDSSYMDFLTSYYISFNVNGTYSQFMKTVTEYGLVGETTSGTWVYTGENDTKYDYQTWLPLGGGAYGVHHLALYKDSHLLQDELATDPLKMYKIS